MKVISLILKLSYFLALLALTSKHLAWSFHWEKTSRKKRKKIFIYPQWMFLIANVDVRALSASVQWHLAVSWSIVATDVEREYQDEVGEVKRSGDKARDAAKRKTRKRETEPGLFEHRLVGVLVSFASRISIRPRIKQPACAFFDLRRCSGRSGACTCNAAVREWRMNIGNQF